MLVDSLLLLALHLHLLLELDRVLLNGTSVHLLGVFVLVEGLELGLILFQAFEAVLEDVISNFDLCVSELLKQVLVLLVILVVSFVLLGLAHLVLMLFVSLVALLSLNKLVVDVLELLQTSDGVLFVLCVTTFLEFVVINA